jgi:hypothetical protein
VVVVAAGHRGLDLRRQRRLERARRQPASQPEALWQPAAVARAPRRPVSVVPPAAAGALLGPWSAQAQRLEPVPAQAWTPSWARTRWSETRRQLLPKPAIS